MKYAKTYLEKTEIKLSGEKTFWHEVYIYNMNARAILGDFLL